LRRRPRSFEKSSTTPMQKISGAYIPGQEMSVSLSVWIAP
jgi:hypothetical protein